MRILYASLADPNFFEPVSR